MKTMFGLASAMKSNERQAVGKPRLRSAGSGHMLRHVQQARLASVDRLLDAARLAGLAHI